MNSAKKKAFATEVIKYCTAIIEAHIEGNDAREVYNDRGYPPSGADPIIDSEVAELGITASDVEKMVQFFENFQKMLDNQQVTTADYRETFNLVRTDI